MQLHFGRMALFPLLAAIKNVWDEMQHLSENAQMRNASAVRTGH